MTVLLGSAGLGTDAPTVAVAWAIPRRVGTAVDRNRIRRRLRSVLSDAHRADPLPAGAYVFHVDPPAAALSFSELSATMRDLLAAARAGAPR